MRIPLKSNKGKINFLLLLEKNKFEFQKLELPKQSLHQDIITDSTLNNSQKISILGYCLESGILCGILGYILSFYINPISNKPILPNKPIKHEIVAIQSKKPTYFKYYDSILFLNQVRGSKKVVSKGFDDYIKRKKLIVKVGDYYYNLFCDDLIDNYAVGDSIP